MSLAAPLLLLAGLYWIGVAFVPEGQVSLRAWCGLYLACSAVALLLWTRAPVSFDTRRWLSIALHSVLFATIFFGADGALDALHGAHRAKARVADGLGGLELWFVLCPGVVSVALAGALRGRVVGRRSG